MPFHYLLQSICGQNSLILQLLSLLLYHTRLIPPLPPIAPVEIIFQQAVQPLTVIFSVHLHFSMVISFLPFQQGSHCPALLFSCNACGLIGWWYSSAISIIKHLCKIFKYNSSSIPLHSGRGGRLVTDFGSSEIKSLNPLTPISD